MALTAAQKLVLDAYGKVGWTGGVTEVANITKQSEDFVRLTLVQYAPPYTLNMNEFHVVFDDFDYNFATPKWTSTDDGGTGTNTLNDTAGGTYSVVTAAADNDYHTMVSASEAWKFADNKPLWFEARVSLTEVNVDDANIVVGFSDTLTTGMMLINGGGPLASYDGCVFCKVDGGTVWQFETSNAGTQATTANAGAFVSGTWYKLGILFDPADGTTGTCTPYIDGTAGTAKNITLSGLEEMHMLFGVAAGDTNAETLIIDYLYCAQAR